MSNRLPLSLTPQIVLRGYAQGVFPMAESATSSRLYWYDPPVRAVIPLDERFHLPARLRRTLKQRPCRVTLNRSFAAVLAGCAAPQPGRESTWINAEITRLYTELYRQGHAHSIEVWRDNALVGGLYGVTLGAEFFGESMFSRSPDASKIALAHLIGLLRHCAYQVLDTQFQTPHLAQFGAFEITRTAYQHILAAAIAAAPLPFPPGAELTAWN